MVHKIKVIGLGAGDINQLPLGIYKELIHTDSPLFSRTNDHPVIATLEKEGVRFSSFDHIYEKTDRFEDVYQQIVMELVEHAERSSLIYVVPGHPMLAEKSVQLLLDETGIEVEIAGGQSYLDDLFTSLQVDPIDGFQFIDGTGFRREELNYSQHIIFCQVYDQFIASEVKLALLEDLPPDYTVTIVTAAGSEQEQLTAVPLEELDRAVEVNNLTSVYVPPAPAHLLNHTFNRLREVIAALRGPDGCPWDKKQTHESLREYAIEEVYELIEAIDEQNDEGIVEELGDLLLQVMLHSQIGADDGYFTVDDVIRSITDKMIHRHPHVFGDKQITTVKELYTSWDELKKQEKGDERKSVLDGVPAGLPSLAKAYKLQKKAANVGFDWDNVEDIWAKLEEEIEEVREAVESHDHENLEKELGDVLFVLANISRYYKVNPETALNLTNEKFVSRFSYIEEQLNDQGKDLTKVSLEEMDHYWNKAKKRE